MNKQHVTSDVLRTYMKILLMTKTHLEGYEPGGFINVTGGNIFREIIAPLYAKFKGRGVESVLVQTWKIY